MKMLTPHAQDASDALQQDAQAFYKELEIDVLARTIWGEARGEGSAGMQAVAAVILNRLSISESRAGFWWGNTIVEICQKPYQFSCWNPNDPNVAKVKQVDERDLHFATALRIARRAVIGAFNDPTEGADHYHAAGISPHWIRGQTPVAVIGNHIFYRLEG